MRIQHGAALPALFILFFPSLSHAHAIVGDRIFPATLAVDDPGVSDELTLPQITRDGGPRNAETDAEFDKRLTENLGVSASAGWVDDDGTSGWDNFSLGAKYVFFKNAQHETMLSSGVDWDIGGTGSARIADRFSTVTPALFFGKGMGDVPVDMLRPFAITGTAGFALPTDRHDDTGDDTTRAIAWGATLQYSLPYLQQHVRDIGLEKPFSTAIPVVEMALDSPVNGGKTTGTVNPGVIFMGQDMQLGLEAVLPVNSASGRGAGAMAQVHFYLDDLFPQTLGRVLW